MSEPIQLTLNETRVVEAIGRNASESPHNVLTYGQGLVLEKLTARAASVIRDDLLAEVREGGV